ncbi:class I SAM-dependent rRNA methyltransferase [Deinococcus detaillensis]|uniref:Class I SAM-dependent rRNA methyltransferase n=1 Tax=Deinococcus detaillensis TaxID=2592048 RepID=A0A553V3Z1_9DEIO|nr:class I SAM-dependent methyltransferase [Deinococcus detaillensis]TSA87104.1 class I SAM-dependent rRNA methyltransferase [Deinococcus detaillensis]
MRNEEQPTQPNAAGSGAASPKRSRLRLRLTPAAEGHIRRGHPWVYESSVREQNREGESGELAVIYDRQDRFLAVGLYDPHSPLRLRVLHAGSPLNLDTAWWKRHLELSVQRRAALFGPDTDGYRLINGESDGWPGLVLDRYASTLVLKLYTSSWLPHLGLLLELLSGRFGNGFSNSAPDSAPNADVPPQAGAESSSLRVVLRLSRNTQKLAAEQGFSDGQVLLGEDLSGPIIFQEYGLNFEADVLRGQKTGFFLDQRENRRIVGSMVEKLVQQGDGRRVLNAFSFSGGFSLASARAGAAEAVCVDISKHALESSRRNFALNYSMPGVSRCFHRTVQADVFAWLGKTLPADAETSEPFTREPFDLIVLDPPSLARRETEREGAVHAYGRLSRQALERLRPGGVLMAASCSSHVSAEEFFEAVRTSARRSGRNWKELRTTRHAPDHHATFTEAEYLKAIYLRVE